MVHDEPKRKIAISEGATIFGSDGEACGRIEAVGARYVTIAYGPLGQVQKHLSIAFIAQADADRVELTISAADAAACATHDPPPDEPIYGSSEPIPEGDQLADGLPVEEREDFGLGGVTNMHGHHVGTQAQA